MGKKKVQIRKPVFISMGVIYIFIIVLGLNLSTNTAVSLNNPYTNSLAS